MPGVGADIVTAVLPAMPRCGYCGGVAHAMLVMCPRVKLVEYYPDGKTLKRVEFHEPNVFSPGTASEPNTCRVQ